jgi:hypothetical protein
MLLRVAIDRHPCIFTSLFEEGDAVMHDESNTSADQENPAGIVLGGARREAPFAEQPAQDLDMVRSPDDGAPGAARLARFTIPNSGDQTYWVVVNGAGKGFDDIVKEPSTFSLPELENLTTAERESHLAKLFDERGLDRQYKFGTLQWTLASVLKQHAKLRHGHEPEGLNDPKILHKLFGAALTEQKAADATNTAYDVKAWAAHHLAMSRDRSYASVYTMEDQETFQGSFDRRWQAHGEQPKAFDVEKALYELYLEQTGGYADFERDFVSGMAGNETVRQTPLQYMKELIKRPGPWFRITVPCEHAAEHPRPHNFDVREELQKKEDEYNSKLAAWFANSIEDKLLSGASSPTAAVAAANGLYDGSKTETEEQKKLAELGEQIQNYVPFIRGVVATVEGLKKGDSSLVASGFTSLIIDAASIKVEATTKAAIKNIVHQALVTGGANRILGGRIGEEAPEVGLNGYATGGVPPVPEAEDTPRPSAEAGTKLPVGTSGSVWQVDREINFGLSVTATSEATGQTTLFLKEYGTRNIYKSKEGQLFTYDSGRLEPISSARSEQPVPPESEPAPAPPDPAPEAAGAEDAPGEGPASAQDIIEQRVAEVLAEHQDLAVGETAAVAGINGERWKVAHVDAGNGPELTVLKPVPGDQTWYQRPDRIGDKYYFDNDSGTYEAAPTMDGGGQKTSRAAGRADADADADAAYRPIDPPPGIHASFNEAITNGTSILRLVRGPEVLFGPRLYEENAWIAASDLREAQTWAQAWNYEVTPGQISTQIYHHERSYFVKASVPGRGFFYARPVKLNLTLDQAVEINPFWKDFPTALRNPGSIPEWFDPIGRRISVPGETDVYRMPGGNFWKFFSREADAHAYRMDWNASYARGTWRKADFLTLADGTFAVVTPPVTEAAVARIDESLQLANISLAPEDAAAAAAPGPSRAAADVPRQPSDLAHEFGDEGEGPTPSSSGTSRAPLRAEPSPGPSKPPPRSLFGTLDEPAPGPSAASAGGGEPPPVGELAPGTKVHDVQEVLDGGRRLKVRDEATGQEITYERVPGLASTENRYWRAEGQRGPMLEYDENTGTLKAPAGLKGGAPGRKRPGEAIDGSAGGSDPVEIEQEAVGWTFHDRLLSGLSIRRSMTEEQGYRGEDVWVRPRGDRVFVVARRSGGETAASPPKLSKSEPPEQEPSLHLLERQGVGSTAHSTIGAPAIEVPPAAVSAPQNAPGAPERAHGAKAEPVETLERASADEPGPSSSRASEPRAPTAAVKNELTRLVATTTREEVAGWMLEDRILTAEGIRRYRIDELGYQDHEVWLEENGGNVFVVTSRGNDELFIDWKPRITEYEVEEVVWSPSREGPVIKAPPRGTLFWSEEGRLVLSLTNAADPSAAQEVAAAWDLQMQTPEFADLGKITVWKDGNRWGLFRDVPAEMRRDVERALRHDHDREYFLAPERYKPARGWRPDLDDPELPEFGSPLAIRTLGDAVPGFPNTFGYGQGYVTFFGNPEEAKLYKRGADWGGWHQDRTVILRWKDSDEVALYTAGVDEDAWEQDFRHTYYGRAHAGYYVAPPWTGRLPDMRIPPIVEEWSVSAGEIRQGELAHNQADVYEFKDGYVTFFPTLNDARIAKARWDAKWVSDATIVRFKDSGEIALYTLRVENTRDLVEYANQIRREWGLPPDTESDFTGYPTETESESSDGGGASGRSSVSDRGDDSDVPVNLPGPPELTAEQHGLVEVGRHYVSPEGYYVPPPAGPPVPPYEPAGISDDVVREEQWDDSRSYIEQHSVPVSHYPDVHYFNGLYLRFTEDPRGEALSWNAVYGAPGREAYVAHVPGDQRPELAVAIPGLPADEFGRYGLPQPSTMPDAPPPPAYRGHYTPPPSYAGEGLLNGRTAEASPTPADQAAALMPGPSGTEDGTTAPSTPGTAEEEPRTERLPRSVATDEARAPVGEAQGPVQASDMRDARPEHVPAIAAQPDGTARAGLAISVPFSETPAFRWEAAFERDEPIVTVVGVQPMMVQHDMAFS